MNNQQQSTTQHQGSEKNTQGKEEHKLAENPNPRANENIPDSDKEAGPDVSTEDEVGSEITDGEDA